MVSVMKQQVFPNQKTLSQQIQLIQSVGIRLPAMAWAPLMPSNMGFVNLQVARPRGKRTSDLKMGKKHTVPIELRVLWS